MTTTELVSKAAAAGMMILLAANWAAASAFWRWVARRAAKGGAR